MSTAFSALEYHRDGSFRPASYDFRGSEPTGWTIRRNGEDHLDLGPGYRLLRTVCCGICSTDLDRHFLPFPLPQVTGHELIASGPAGERFVVEINASHQARGIGADCPFCSDGLATHCPERRVLGIHDLPGGFGPWVLAPVEAAIPVPPEIPDEAAVLIEPFAAALHAVRRLDLRPGDRVAVLGPRRLGLLVVAALAAWRRVHHDRYRILALSRHSPLLTLSQSLGADEVIGVPPGTDSLPADLADVVIDTTASPAGLELALRLASREVHLKSTHGQPSVGLRHLTELVVDEISLARFPAAESDGGRLLYRLGSTRRDGRARIAWLARTAAPAWLPECADILQESEAITALSAVKANLEGLPRADVAVVDSGEQIDAALRPSSQSEESLVRPRGEIWLLPSGRADTPQGPLERAVLRRGQRLSSSRCGDFHHALELVRQDTELLRMGRRLITHRFPAYEIERAFRTARSRGCIKAIVEH